MDASEPVRASDTPIRWWSVVTKGMGLSSDERMGKNFRLRINVNHRPLEIMVIIMMCTWIMLVPRAANDNNGCIYNTNLGDGSY